MKIVFIIILFFVGIFVAYQVAYVSGARQMARHILNPEFETLKFYAIMGEECGNSNGWIEKAGSGKRDHLQRRSDDRW